MSKRPWQAGSPARAWARRQFPRLRVVVLAPRRTLHHRRWKRRHTELSRADRELLTEVILPSVRQEADSQDVLFVGVEWYTGEYSSMFPEGNLVTMDVNEGVARHGARRHLTADVLDLDRHFDAGHFAAIVCNGVFGYGVDTMDDVRRALQVMRCCLRPGGLLVIGWNDTDDRRIGGLDELAAEVGLQPIAGAGLSAWRTGPIGPLHHMYDVYRRAPATDVS